jgi:hypothetical protein
MRLRRPRIPGPSVAEIKQRLDNEQQRHETPEPGGRVAVRPWSRTHQAPPTPFTVDEAHLVMQQHRRCLGEACARKRAAFRVLVHAGHAVPAQRAENWLLDD